LVGANAVDVWSTAEVAQPRAFDYWRHLICDTFVQLSADPVADEGFAGQIIHRSFAGLEMSTVRAGGQRVRRTRQLIARSNEEYLLASIQTAGRGQVEQDGRTAILEPGAMSFYDSTRPYTLNFDGPFEQIVVQVPLEWAVATAGVLGPKNLTAVALGRDGATGVVADFFRSLASAQQHDPVGAELLTGHASGLLAAALSLAAGQPADNAPRASLQREQVISFLRAHLSEPTLDIETIARGCYLSRRTLFRHFAGEADGVIGLLKRMRVERAQQLLRQYPERPVRAVGYACGFAGEAQFHRAFRELTGSTPARFRASGSAGTAGQSAGTTG